MKFLRWLFSKVWVEQNSVIKKPGSSSDTKIILASGAPGPVEPLVNGDLAPYSFEGDIFHFTVSNSWILRADSTDQNEEFRLDHSQLDLGLRFFQINVETPEDRLQEIAKKISLMRSNELDQFKRENGLYPVGVVDDVREMSWGYQANFTRTYVNREFYNSYILVAPKLILNFCFEGSLSNEDAVNLEIEKIMRALRFDDAFWGDREIPDGLRLN